MKKIFSVFLAALMIVSFSVSTFAWFSPITTDSAKDAFTYYISLEYATDVIATIANGGAVDAGVYSGDNSIGVSSDGRNGSAARNYYIENNGANYVGGDTVQTKIIDTSTNTVNYINKSVTNYYETNNYTNMYYNQTYNTFYSTINNNNYYIQYTPTYVTVVNGTSAEDAKISRFYFKLPDGRNSSNLTAADVYGMVFGYDAINYDSVLEEPSLQLLCHFDGNHDDSGPNAIAHSYSAGSSISFSSSGRFDECLYWTKSEKHSMSYYLPSAPDDFTFECFVKITDATFTNSSAFTTQLGGKTFFTITLGSYKPILFTNYKSDSSSSTVNSTALFVGVEGSLNSTEIAYDLLGGTGISQGVFYHVAVVHSGTTVKYYINGTLIYSYTATKTFSSIKLTGNYYYNAPAAGGVFTYSGNTYIDEMRLCNSALYSSNFTPPASPFDSSLVLVLPDDVPDNTIAVQTNIPVSALRIGGVRPTLPVVGFVYIYLSSGVVGDTQVYDGTQWVSVNSVISDGGSWVTTTDYELAPVSSDTGSGGDDDDDDDDDGGGTTLPDITGILSFITSLANLIISPINAIFEVLAGLLTTFTAFAASFSSFLGALFSFIPSDLLAVYTLGITLAIVLAFIKFLRG